jgi:hypothetical protein
VNIERLTTPWWALRVGLGAAAFLAGLDKFFNLLADWPTYLSPMAAQVLPLSPASFMHVIGPVEIRSARSFSQATPGWPAMWPPSASAASRSIW